MVDARMFHILSESFTVKLVFLWRHLNNDITNAKNKY